MHDPKMGKAFSIMRAQDVSAIRTEQDVTTNKGLLHAEVHAVLSERQRSSGHKR